MDKNQVSVGVGNFGNRGYCSGSGIFLEIQYTDLPYDPRIITGLGILFAGIGIGNLVRYRAAMKDGQSARRLTIEERDERTVLIKPGQEIELTGYLPHSSTPG